MSTSKPRTILGLMTIGPDASAGARITSLDDFKQILDSFQAQGYNEIDTARVYMAGDQESFTAQAGWKERGLTVATKWYPLQPGFHKPEVLREKLDESLRELGTDTVDIFYLHAPDRSVPFVETLKEVDRLYREGKFTRLGLSNYTAFEVAEIVMTCQARGWVRPTVYQAMYNSITRTIETELIPACRRYGLDIVIYNPIAAGVLAGKYKTPDVPLEGRYSAQSPTGHTYRGRYFKDSTFEALRIIEAAAGKHGLTTAECAFRWLRHHSQLRMGLDGNDGVVIGVSSLAQLESNLRDLEKGPLPENVVRAFDEAWMVTKADAVVYWHGQLEYSYDIQKVLFEGS
ncbi:NADP-dependent oxidoreductase domain-containing protein [Aspergillus granulosus]|uniref:NADP-dependent oxidoreductase domain-containing protein n=1 Tax=Aspergillus granulosus TaxID=176169 RepID=A0ABR4GS30_9EURO